jgi:hypothetical protein
MGSKSVAGAFLGAMMLLNGAAPAAQASKSNFDPLALYGNEIVFDVWRGDERVGRHTVRFQGDDGDLVVETAFDLEISFLFFTAYEYLYRSNARWRDGKLSELRATSDENGEASEVRVFARDGRLVIEGGKDTQSTSPDSFPTNHWNPGVLGKDSVINTISGRVNAVEIRPKGREKIDTPHGTIEATRFAYTGDLETEVWYDDQGRWVKMRFEAKDGSVIDYRCQICRAEKVAESRQ